MRRGLLATAIVLTALMVQAVVINPMRLPGGGPDLPGLGVVAFPLVAGPTYGVVTGFLVGLAADVLPPADHTLGRLAVAYAVGGYAAGLVEDGGERAGLTTIAGVAVASAGTVVLFAGVGALLGDARITVSAMLRSLTATVIYDVVLAP